MLGFKQTNNFSVELLTPHDSATLLLHYLQYFASLNIEENHLTLFSAVQALLGLNHAVRVQPIVELMALGPSARCYTNCWGCRKLIF